MNGRNRPNYYAIIPAKVRYDKNLKPAEKILYGELTALSNKNGYCHAKNRYFANLYNVSNETETQLFCSHSYVSGIYQKHILNGKGGCTTYYYENAKICSKCNNIILGSVTNKVIFQKCIH